MRPPSIIFWNLFLAENGIIGSFPGERYSVLSLIRVYFEASPDSAMEASNSEVSGKHISTQRSYYDCDQRPHRGYKQSTLFNFRFTSTLHCFHNFTTALCIRLLYFISATSIQAIFTLNNFWFGCWIQKSTFLLCRLFHLSDPAGLFSEKLDLYKAVNTDILFYCLGRHYSYTLQNNELTSIPDWLFIYLKPGLVHRATTVPTTIYIVWLEGKQ